MSSEEERMPILDPEEEEDAHGGEEKADAWVERLAAALQRKDFVDLSAAEDLSFALMNLISIEEHLACSYSRTGDEMFLDALPEIRRQRRDLMKSIVREGHGEGWCIAKHLLASSMRLLEVANKRQSDGRLDEARDLIGRAFTLWGMFWLFTEEGKGVQVASGPTQQWAAPRTERTAEPREQIRQTPHPRRQEAQTVGPVARLVKAFIDCCRDG